MVLLVKSQPLQVVEGARTRGVSKIIGVDINPEKFIKGIIFLLVLLIVRNERKDSILIVSV